jgi:hypothetical protein
MPQESDAARSALVMAARDLGQDLRAAKKLLDRMDDRLKRRVEIRMGTHLARGIRQADLTLQHAQPGGGHPADVWAEVHTLRWEVDELLQECLMLVQGRSDRAFAFDDGYCALADALVDELVARTPVGHWSSFTVVGRSDQYSRASRVIQVRFPPTSIWQLALVAHELGHYVGPALAADRGLRSQSPLIDLGEQRGDGSRESWAWLEELFADAFATRLLGPAYGFTCVLSAFDPLLAEVPTPSHPAPQQRVGVITAMLERAGNEQMDWAAKHLGDAWAELVDASEGAEGRTPVGDSPYREGLVDLLDDLLPISAYAGWARADELATALLGKGDRPEGISLADTVNAAWRARLRSPAPSVVDDIGRQAVALCRDLVKGSI